MDSHTPAAALCALYGLKYHMVSIIIVLLLLLLSSHFTCEEIQAQREEKACLISHIQWVVELGI